MYAKVFAQIFDSSLREKWQGWVVFVAMLALADESDDVDMTVEALTARTGLPGSVVAEGLAHLEKPDPYSRTPDAEGRRIVRLDDHRAWGWHIVNRGKYKAIRDNRERREYMREYMRNRRKPVSTAVNPSQPQVVGSSEQLLEANTPSPNGSAPKRVSRISKPENHPPGFDLFWEAYKNDRGRRVEKPAALSEWKRSKLEDIVVQVLAALEVYKRSEEWRDGFMPYPAKWLKRRMWDDTEMSEPEFDPLWDGPRVRR